MDREKPNYLEWVGRPCMYSKPQPTADILKVMVIVGGTTKYLRTSSWWNVSWLPTYSRTYNISLNIYMRWRLFDYKRSYCKIASFHSQKNFRSWIWRHALICIPKGVTTSWNTKLQMCERSIFHTHNENLQQMNHTQIQEVPLVRKYPTLSALLSNIHFH